ncbi:Fpg/Nei family DNA glycosylase [Pedobacter antarcticus]|uniref:Fpg/Nei family DNA glycosylase n=1 Tax=Pedobacter antarcticus TaxID=34086 RepID=UPI001C58F952|nr:DNA-formamidopyrimidine glycosylase family protein [Pedobacter antarcticus]
MPELPDLEVFAGNLNRRFKGQRVTKVSVKWAKKLNVKVAELEEAVTGKKVTEICRSGKTLVCGFEGGVSLGFHLMLHGEIHLVAPGDEEPRFEIIGLYFDNDTILVITDFQKAAVVTLNPETPEVPDALDLKPGYLHKLLQGKRTQVKQVLLDQKSIRGIGNAYADEILWKAGVSPFSIAKALPDTAVKKLGKAISDVLNQAVKNIKKENPDRVSGEYREFLKIHNSKLEKTPDGEEIRVDKKGSRKTYYTDSQIKYMPQD